MRGARQIIIDQEGCHGAVRDNTGRDFEKICGSWIFSKGTGRNFIHAGVG